MKSIAVIVLSTLPLLSAAVFADQSCEKCVKPVDAEFQRCWKKATSDNQKKACVMKTAKAHNACIAACKKTAAK